MAGVYSRSNLIVTGVISPLLSPARSFSVLYRRTKQPSNEQAYLKGARLPERSFRVMSKEGAKMPSDIGLLEKTLIMPTGLNRPSFYKAPISILKLEWTRILARSRDFLSLLLCKFTSPKITNQWNRTFNLNRSSLVPTATALHHQMYTAFAEGDDLVLRDMCLEGIRDNFRNRIANRPREEKVVWELVRYNKKPKLVSNRAAKTPINGMILRQAVVRICSRQKLTRYMKTPNGALEQIHGSGKEKDVVEYMVIQRIHEQWQPLNWMVWGTAKETTLEDLEEWKKA